MASSHSRKRVDITGNRYGSLTVLAPAENRGKRTAWLCQCDCGKQVVYPTYHLRSGHVKSCGCRKAAGIDLTYVDGTCVEMLRGNQTPRSNNTSGVVGVEWMASKQRWRATLCFKGRRYYLGRFAQFEDAVAARKAAEAKYLEPFLAQFPQKEAGH